MFSLTVIFTLFHLHSVYRTWHQSLMRLEASWPLTLWTIWSVRPLTHRGSEWGSAMLLSVWIYLQISRRVSGGHGVSVRLRPLQVDGCGSLETTWNEKFCFSVWVNEAHVNSVLFWWCSEIHHVGSKWLHTNHKIIFHFSSFDVCKELSFYEVTSWLQ